VFEHAGPTVRIGRDPEGELVLEGDASNNVSRSHVRIDLGPDGAILRDMGSSNGTLVNDRPIKGPVSLAVNDRISLGYTGPKLSVIEVELPVAVPEATSGDQASSGWWLIGAVLALIVTVAVVWLVVNRVRS
jgi:pSer/pThr/pTyr-binding forkhead associated (FHA) protein